MAGPLHLVEPPAPSPAPFGLLETLGPAVESGGDNHWQAGVLYQALCPQGGSTYAPCVAVTGIGEPPPPPAKADNVDLNLRAATPFTVFAYFECSPIGREDVDSLAEQALARVEGWQAERAIWSGQAGGQQVVFPRLAAAAAVTGGGPAPGQTYQLQSAAVTPVAGTLSPGAALGALEGALADCYRGQQGVIHAPQAAVDTLAAARLIERRGAQLQTVAGNLVVAGGGYPGTSPAGAAPAAGTAWLYATGRAFYYRGAVRTIPLRESIDRAANTARLLAERTYLAGWDCCHFAALLNLA
jgi:hypothetical protein